MVEFLDFFQMSMFVWNVKVQIALCTVGSSFYLLSLDSSAFLFYHLSTPSRKSLSHNLYFQCTFIS